MRHNGKTTSQSTTILLFLSDRGHSVILIYESFNIDFFTLVWKDNFRYLYNWVSKVLHGKHTQTQSTCRWVQSKQKRNIIRKFNLSKCKEELENSVL